jgi:hypothetical protein
VATPTASSPDRARVANTVGYQDESRQTCKSTQFLAKRKGVDSIENTAVGFDDNNGNGKA